MTCYDRHAYQNNKYSMCVCVCGCVRSSVCVCMHARACVCGGEGGGCTRACVCIRLLFCLSTHRRWVVLSKGQSMVHSGSGVAFPGSVVPPLVPRKSAIAEEVLNLMGPGGVKPLGLD